MKEFKALTESQLELLDVKIGQIQNTLKQIQLLQTQNTERIERMKSELGIPAKESRQWQFSKNGKNFEREKPVKKTIPKKGKKDKE